MVSRAYPGVHTPAGLVHSVAWADDRVWLGGSKEDADAIAGALPVAEDAVVLYPRCACYALGWRGSEFGMGHPQSG